MVYGARRRVSPCVILWVVCGRFTNAQSRYDLARAFRVDETTKEELPASWNVAPTENVYAVTTSRPRRTRRLRTLRWGLVPSWAKDPSTGNKMINARAETVSTKPAYRKALVTRRCLIPADGFYEWKRAARAGKTTQPFYVHSVDGNLLAFAGLWETWSDAERHPLYSCSILTTRANKTMSEVHNRMPVILPPDDWDEWLAPERLEDKELRRLLSPAPKELLLLDPISAKVNDAKNKGPRADQADCFCGAPNFATRTEAVMAAFRCRHGSRSDRRRR